MVAIIYILFSFYAYEFVLVGFKNNNLNNKWSNYFDERLHLCLVTPHGGEWTRPTLTSIYGVIYAGSTSQSPKWYVNRISRLRRSRM